MKILPSKFGYTFLLTGVAALCAAPSYGQLPKKILPAVRAGFSANVSTPLAQKILAPNILMKSFGPSVAVYAVRPPLPPAAQPAMLPPAYTPFYPLKDAETAQVASLLQKKLSKPAPTFHDLFKQAVYLHQKNPAVFNQVNQQYYYEMTLFLQHAAYTVQQKGYPLVAAYLKEHKGNFPALTASGELSSSPQADRLLTFYASEEMGRLLSRVLARPTAKQALNDEEWVAVNVLSTLFPPRTRRVFYNLLLDQKYQELQILSLDPYMHQEKTRRLAAGKPLPQRLQPPSVEQRIAAREKRLRTLLQQQANLPAVLAHKRKQYAKNKIIYDILHGERQSHSAEAAKKALDKSFRSYTQTQLQLEELSSQIQQIKNELHFLRTH